MMKYGGAVLENRNFYTFLRMFSTDLDVHKALVFLL